MEDLACIAGVHAAHLARTFRKRFGRTVGTYVRERRLTHAARLLRESALPLTDISAESGFYDQSHFTRAFTRRFGVSPARYRRIVRM
jgi:AraC family transcriptional regulator